MFRKMLNQNKNAFLWLEFLGFFIVLPGVLAAFPQTFTVSRLIFTFLWAMMVYCLMVFWQDRTRVFDLKINFTKRALSMVMKRFATVTILLAAYTYFFEHKLLFNFPLTKPEIWAIVMIMYPILSVFPQEFIYRAFFFERYKNIFKNNHIMIIVNGVVFGWSHIVLQNGLAVIFSIIGGILFARTYARHKSLQLVMIEHSLYGNLIFTLGLGWYFFSGRIG